VLVDPEGGTQVDSGSNLAKCGWSPFDGMQFRARIQATLVNGQLAWRDGSLTGQIYGKPLEFRGR